MPEDLKKTTDDLQDRIREVAYLMWESAGRRTDRAMEYWLAAEREVRANIGAATGRLMSPVGENADATAGNVERTVSAAVNESAAATAGKTGYKVEQIEQIGRAYASKLATAGIDTTGDLLEQCGSAKGRDAVARQAGVSARQLLKWANMADLMRISGVGGEYAELLEASGVDTVKELRTRNAENLAAKMSEINTKKNLTRRLASARQVAKWIDQAKSLDPVITH